MWVVDDGALECDENRCGGVWWKKVGERDEVFVDKARGGRATAQVTDYPSNWWWWGLAAEVK